VRRLSRHGVDFIARWEGFRSCPYQDAVGVWTIGYGHTEGVSRTSRCITQRKAKRLLRRDARTAARAVRRLVDVKLNQNQFDALVSFVFNVGTGAFASSTLLRELNKGNRHLVPVEFGKWIYGGGRPLEGLRRRRAAEARLFKRNP
jgi:lysozyme